MKQGIHPEYSATSIRCACGNVIETRSTIKEMIQVEICSSCHPFFTGQQKIMDTAGRIDRFKKKFGDKVVGTQKYVPTVEAPKPKKEPKEDKKVIQKGGAQVAAPKAPKEAPKAAAPKVKAAE